MSTPRLPLVLSSAAVVWSVALVAGAYWLPAYSGSATETTCSDAGTHCTTTSSSSTATLVQMNGDRVLVVIGALAALAATAWLGLHLRRARGSQAGLVAAWAAAVTTLAVALVSFGLGLAVAPMAVMMIVAAATTPAPATTGPGGPDRAGQLPTR